MSRPKLIVAIVAVVVLLLCGCMAVACTPVGNTVGVHHDSDSYRKSKKSKKCVARDRKHRCTRYR